MHFDHKLITLIGLEPLPCKTVEAGPKLPMQHNLAGEEEEPARNRVMYNSSETVGYAAARLPGCYAVIWRVLDELDMRLSDFRPKSMLDFGAGPGTAIWAASEVNTPSYTDP